MDELIKIYNATTLDAERACFYTRSIDFQKNCIKELEVLAQEIDSSLKEYIEQFNEESANLALYLKTTVLALKNEVQMWVYLKTEEYDNAWDALISAQNGLTASLRIRPTEYNLENRLRHLEGVERLVFPPQTFSSHGSIVKKSTCSICNGPYQECDHIKGRPYMGQFCVEIIEELQLLEVSIVEHPKDKRCRVTSISDNTGRKRDLFTWELIDRQPS